MTRLDEIDALGGQLLELAAEDEMGLWEALQEARALFSSDDAAHEAVVSLLSALFERRLVEFYRYDERGAQVPLPRSAAFSAIADENEFRRPSTSSGGMWFTATAAGRAEDARRRGAPGRSPAP